MSFEQKISEPKRSKCGTFSTRNVKLGNRLMGIIEIPKLEPGKKPEATYWATPQVIQESLVWPNMLLIPRSAGLASLRAYGVQKVGVKYQDGTEYLTGIDVVLDRNFIPADRKELFLRIPKDLWAMIRPSEEMRVLLTMDKMRISGGRRKSSVTDLL